MSSGRIRDFTKEGKSEPQTRILSQGNPIPQQENREQTVDVTVHEEIIREGDGKVRVREGDGIEIRVRQPKDIEKWENVKRGDE